MNTPEKPDYGEPWIQSHETILDHAEKRIAEILPPFQAKSRLIARRITQCVNAMAGRPDPAAAMARLAQLERENADMRDRLAELEWVPVEERRPTSDDSNYFDDVEWSDGRDIWQGNYKDDDTATHWRSITLP